MTTDIMESFLKIVSQFDFVQKLMVVTSEDSFNHWKFIEDKMF